MTEEQIKQTSKITEFARNMVKQSNYPIDLQDHIIATCMVVVTEATKELEKENAELKNVADFQQSSNMSRYFENKKLKEGLAVGSTFNKALNSINKNLEEERDKYRNMVFDKDDQLTKAKEIIKMLHSDCYSIAECEDTNLGLWEDDLVKAEQFLNSEVDK